MRWLIIAVIIGTFWIGSLLFNSSAMLASILLFLAYWLFIILTLIWLVGKLVSIFRKSPNKINYRYLLIPIVIAFVALVSLLLNLLNTPSALLDSGTVSEELEYMRITDENDRFAILPFMLMPERDIARINRVLELLESANDLSAEDKYNMAYILHHSEDSSEQYEMAYHLASEANETGYENDLWMMAYDRWQLSLGNEQLYDTQSSMTFGIRGIDVQTP
ncbi:MAG: hypothetical protein Phog2KO_46620 [Phototrophicaceae bacterium]